MLSAEANPIYVPTGNSPREFIEPHWYAVHTSANHEKRVCEQLQGRSSVEVFLPLYETVRRWKDRRVQLRLPLFPGYLFTRLALKDRLSVLQLSGVAHFVSSSGRPISMPDGEMECLREGLCRQLRAEPHPYLCVGQHVRLKSGPLKGMEGILTRKKSMLRVVLSLDLIARSISVEVGAEDIAPVS